MPLHLTEDVQLRLETPNEPLRRSFCICTKYDTKRIPILHIRSVVKDTERISSPQSRRYYLTVPDTGIVVSNAPHDSSHAVNTSAISL